jgi:hypothetical protein
MAKQAQQRTAGTGRKRVGAIHVDVKLNILHTIADAIYSTPAGKIREAVANSRDNGATWVMIAVDQMNDRLSVVDNGTGITRERFQEIFENIGYPLLRSADETKLSYFGIGLMSIFQLGRKVRVFTRPRGVREILSLGIDTGAIFDPANKNKSISFLTDCLRPLEDTTDSVRRRASIPLLNDRFDCGEPTNFPDSFTEIIIEEIDSGDLEEICSGAFQEVLSKVLPLRAQDDEPFLRRFTGKKAKELRQLLQRDDYCRTVDVYFGTQEEGVMQQLWKYFPRFNSRITFPDDNVHLSVPENGSFAYYVVHTVAEDLQQRGVELEEEERETGFWIRNQNFLVKSADFLDKPGPGRKPKGTIDKPLRNWVFGEIFHKNMNPFLTVGRNEFLFEHREFKAFRSEFLEVVFPLNKALREIWQRRKDVVEDFVRPFAEIVHPTGPFARAQQKLRILVGEKLDERAFHEQVRAGLSKCRVPKIERDDARVDVILRKTKRPILLGEAEGTAVRIDPALSGRVETCEVRWDAFHKQVVVDVSPNLFDPKPVVFLSEQYTVFYVAEKESESGLSVDVESHRIYINPFNRELSRYSLSILDVYIALEVADAMSHSQAELKRNFLRLLGPAPSLASRYISPLGDDLRRTAALSR